MRSDYWQQKLKNWRTAGRRDFLNAGDPGDDAKMYRVTKRDTAITARKKIAAGMSRGVKISEINYRLSDDDAALLSTEQKRKLWSAWADGYATAASRSAVAYAKRYG